MKSKNEEFCKLKFDGFLRASSKSILIRWEDIAQKDEPPDYFLHLGSDKYAVEVSILMEKKEVGNHQLSSAAITASLWKIVDEVEEIARKNNYLHGAYVVSFSRPIDNLKNVRDELFNTLLEYVTETQHLNTAPEKVVFKHGFQYCKIQKLHDETDYIGQIGPSGSKWEVEAKDEICNLLEERINSKNQKLSKISEPKILLLYDAYHFADQEMYKRCTSSISALTLFHTIFIVQVNNNGFLLSSQNKSWL